ncbi:MAG: L,D-transpeptidase family protein, partial [bacterium]
IAQISDVHLGLIIREDRLKRIIARIEEAQPDILVATGDLSHQEADSAVLDGAVMRGLQAFQRRHGLSPSGRLDAATASALRVSARERANQLAAALERWRWLPHELGSRYVLVRIADFELDLVEDGRPVMTRRVVVGEPYRRTPVFGSRIERLVVNPSWYIPERIAREEVLPLLQADPEASARLGIRVWAGPGQAGSPVDWGAVANGDGPARLVQLPGPPNPLGKIKFDFANPFQVYLHDTPNPAVFGARERDSSHGCVRVEGARELGAHLMGPDGGRGAVELAAAWESTETRILELPEPVPIYFLYWTARVTADGEVHFRRDLYDGDRRLMAVLGLQ